MQKWEKAKNNYMKQREEVTTTLGPALAQRGSFPSEIYPKAAE